jgi:hypothetical protein
VRELGFAEIGVQGLLKVQTNFQPLLDRDGFLRNWLVDAVREMRRGNPGAARYELNQLRRRLAAELAKW